MYTYIRLRLNSNNSHSLLKLWIKQLEKGQMSWMWTGKFRDKIFNGKYLVWILALS